MESRWLCPRSCRQRASVLVTRVPPHTFPCAPGHSPGKCGIAASNLQRRKLKPQVGGGGWASWAQGESNTRSMRDLINPDPQPGSSLLSTSAHWMRPPGQGLPFPEPLFSHLHNGDNDSPPHRGAHDRGRETCKTKPPTCLDLKQCLSPLGLAPRGLPNFQAVRLVGDLQGVDPPRQTQGQRRENQEPQDPQICLSSLRRTTSSGHSAPMATLATVPSACYAHCPSDLSPSGWNPQPHYFPQTVHIQHNCGGVDGYPVQTRHCSSSKQFTGTESLIFTKALEHRFYFQPHVTEGVMQLVSSRAGA